MKLIAVRHGPTQSTEQRRLQGWNDEPLTSEGERSVELLAKELAAHDSDIIAIVTSSLQRTQQTAAIIAAHLGKRTQDIVVDDCFKERNFGTLTGLTWDEVKKTVGIDLRSIDLVLRYDYTRFRGESHATVRGRIRMGVENLVSSFAPNDTVLLVTHGGVIRHLNELYGPSGEQDPLDIDAINRFVVNAAFRGPSDAQL